MVATVGAYSVSESVAVAGSAVLLSVIARPGAYPVRLSVAVLGVTSAACVMLTVGW